MAKGTANQTEDSDPKIKEPLFSLPKPKPLLLSIQAYSVASAEVNSEPLNPEP